MDKTTKTILWVLAGVAVIIIIANWNKIKQFCGGGYVYRGGGGIGHGGRLGVISGPVYPYYTDVWVCDERADGVNCTKCHSSNGNTASGGACGNL